ncbi:uncharacterized protein LOC142166992 [Nicotiana tabacum]|uniref:Uncharacterized protein LOC142166992 n=1 Tax=Nicotiana tabacum TaxID=4097 RepID=A0AC58SE47_TOBAC
MKREKLDNQFAKFLEILKQIHINILFTDALLQMPSYAKFFKEILSSKRKLEEVSVVMLTEKCSAILQNKLPQKLGDPGSFTIPCTLGGVYIEKALCDSGALINLMPFPIFKKLDLGEMKDKGVSLQFADQSRPFIATGRAIIDVHQGQLILRVDEERVIFDMQKILRFSEDDTSSSCFSIDMINNLIDKFKDDQLISDSMERCLAKSGTIQNEDLTIRNDAKLLEKDYEEGGMQLEAVQLKNELKTLPSHLKYVYLEHELFSVIISYSLTTEQEERLIKVLKAHKGALGWTVEDIKGINLAIWTHRILMEDNYKPIVQPQRRLIPTMQEVVKKEIVKLLAACIIYPILDSPWRCMSAIFSDMTEKFLEIFMYDSTLFGKGHKITAKEIEVDRAKINLIAGLPPPTTIKGIRSFLSHAGDCMKAFDTLKEKLSTAPVVVSPDWNQPFEVMCDASDTIVGAILGQRKDKNFRPIYYANKTMNKAQLNYATTEKELLAVVFAFDKFRSYLIRTKVTVFTNHVTLKYLLAKKYARPRLLRWILLLQEFELEIKDKNGTENQVADHLSRLENPPLELCDIKEEFLDEHIFSINSVVTQPPWFADIINYFVGKWTPQNLTYQPRKKLISNAKYYLWNDHYLFKICAYNIIRRCVPEEEMIKILYHCHDRAVGGHYAANRTTFKVLEVGFFWPTLFKDARAYVAQCDRCQRTSNITKRDEMPLQSI